LKHSKRNKAEQQHTAEKKAGKLLVVCETFRSGRTTKNGGYILDLANLGE
jgi:hypothetical protein